MLYSLSVSLALSVLLAPAPVTFDTRYNWQHVWSSFKDSNEIILKAQNTQSDRYFESTVPNDVQIIDQNVKKNKADSGNLCLVCKNLGMFSKREFTDKKSKIHY